MSISKTNSKTPSPFRERAGVRMLFILILLACASLANAQDEMMQPLPLDPGTRVGKLDNGLTYYLRSNKYPEGQANFYIAQKVGSVLEEDDQRGLAHFLEHMCFNGTKNFPGDQVVRYLESIGVKFGEQLNAYTSVEETVYNINNVPTAREATIDSVLLILHDWSHDLLLEPEEIDKERGVIHEEWRNNNKATMRIYERQLPKLMSNSRPGNRLPIGTMEVVDNFPYEALRAYYEKWYRPDQQAIIVVGDLDIDRLEAKLKEMFSPIEMPENAAVREQFPVPDNAEPIVVSDCDKEQTMAIISVMQKHEAFPREYKGTLYYLVNSLLQGAATSMLNQRLYELSLDPAAPYIQASVGDGGFMLSKATECFSTDIVPKEGQISEAVQTVMQEVYRAAKHGFTETEYIRWRTEFLSRIQALYDNKDKREHPTFIRECVDHFVNAEPMPGLETEYMLYNQILPNVPVVAVNQLFAELAAPNDTNLVILSINPEKEGYVQPTEKLLLDALHAAQQADLEAYVDNVKNEPLIATLPKLGKINKDEVGPFGTRVLTLGNGVRVVLKQTDFKDNEVVMRAYSEGGSARYGEADKYTLNMFPALIGASGLGNFTDTELQKALAGVQASVNPTVGNRYEYLSGSAVPKDLRTMFELVYLHFQPLLRDDKAAASVMQQMAEQLRNKEANPMSAFNDSVKTTLYGRHPMLTIMREPDLAKVSYERALEIYAERFADASDFTFLIAGNFEPDSVRLYCQQYLANLPTKRRSDKPVDNGFELRDGKHDNIFSKQMTQPQSMMVMVLHAPEKNNLKTQLVADMIGQVLSMRLLEVIREEMGAAYSVGAQGGIDMTSAGTYQQLLQIYAPVKPEMADTARAVIMQELEKMATEGAEDKYLDKVKEYLVKTFKENERDNGAWLSILDSWFREGVDEYTGYEALVQNIQSNDLRDMARRLLNAGNAATVLILPQE